MAYQYLEVSQNSAELKQLYTVTDTDSMEHSEEPLEVAAASTDSNHLLQNDAENLEELKRQSSKHIRGFLTYSIATEVFSIVSATLFLPLALEQFARDNGYLYPNYQERCPGSKNSGYSESDKNAETSTFVKDQCKIRFFKGWITTGAFPLYISSITVAVQAVVIASIIKLADQANLKKGFLVTFAIMGSFASFMFFFLDSSNYFWPACGVISVIANVGLAASTVCMNSLLPGIAQEKATLIKKKNQIESKETPNFNILISRCSSGISSKGIAIGFATGILALCIALLFAYLNPHESNIAKWSIGASGVFWAVLTLPTALWIPPSKSKSNGKLKKGFNLSRIFKDSWGLQKPCRPIKNTFLYLIAWLLLSSAYSTMTSTAMLFGKIDLRMKESHLVWVGVLTPTMGIFGALSLPIIQRHASYLSGPDSGLRIIKILAYLSAFIPLYVGISDKLGALSLTHEIGIYIIACFFGLFYGAFQAYARTVYAEFIPTGQETKWFALYSITSKIFTCLCTLAVGLITDHTRTMRRGFLYILGLFVFSFPFLHFIDMKEVQTDDGDNSTEEDEKNNN